MNEEDRSRSETLRIKALVQTIVGQRIVAAGYWNADSSGQGGGVDLTLEDGRTFSVDGWGHDWWGVAVEIAPAEGTV